MRRAGSKAKFPTGRMAGIHDDHDPGAGAQPWPQAIPPPVIEDRSVTADECLIPTVRLVPRTVPNPIAMAGKVDDPEVAGTCVIDELSQNGSDRISGEVI